MGTNGISLVHLDLKGAPPKLEYYAQLFPLLRQWGAGGLLVEYEDMFPYWGELEILTAKNMYRQEEVRQIVALAKESDLIVIPLVQTFGHLEFLLKHDKFRHLREVPKYPMSLCPLNPDSLNIVGQMIDQVLSLHPESQWFHIGADEVFHIGYCDQCKAFQADGAQNQDLFLHFSVKVLKFMKEKYPDKGCIMWDDMLRTQSLTLLKAYELGNLVEPMVWQYSQQLEFPEDMWCRYSQAFQSIWIATAYKGATGPAQQATNIAFHIDNHRSWLNLVNQGAALFKNLRGFALTGWQRYDHYAGLCELLPQAIPSLALNLQILAQGVFTFELHDAVSRELGFKVPVTLNPFGLFEPPECQFPGSEIYRGIIILLRLTAEYDMIINSDRVKSWMSEYHVKYNVCNPVHVEHILKPAKKLQKDFEEYKKHMQHTLAVVYYSDTVEEWVCDHILSKVGRLNELIHTAERMLVIESEAQRMESEAQGMENVAQGIESEAQRIESEVQQIENDVHINSCATALPGDNGAMDVEGDSVEPEV